MYKLKKKLPSVRIRPPDKIILAIQSHPQSVDEIREERKRMQLNNDRITSKLHKLNIEGLLLRGRLNEIRTKEKYEYTDMELMETTENLDLQTDYRFTKVLQLNNSEIYEEQEIEFFEDLELLTIDRPVKVLQINGYQTNVLPEEKPQDEYYGIWIKEKVCHEFPWITKQDKLPTVIIGWTVIRNCEDITRTVWERTSEFKGPRSKGVKVLDRTMVAEGCKGSATTEENQKDLHLDSPLTMVEEATITKKRRKTEETQISFTEVSLDIYGVNFTLLNFKTRKKPLQYLVSRPPDQPSFLFLHPGSKRKWIFQTNDSSDDSENNKKVKRSRVILVRNLRITYDRGK